MLLKKIVKSKMMQSSIAEFQIAVIENFWNVILCYIVAAILGIKSKFVSNYESICTKYHPVFS